MESWANNFIGIPFVSGGRTREGCDCYGLLRLVEKEIFKIDLPEITGYNEACNAFETIHFFEKNTPLLLGQKLTQPKSGSIAIMLNKGLPTHIGIYVGDGYILHTDRKIGSCIQRMSDRVIAKRIEGFYELTYKSSGSSVPEGDIH